MSLVSLLSFREKEGSTGMIFQGTGRSTKEILKRIDYGGSLTLLGAVSLKRWIFLMGAIHSDFQVGSLLIFLSMRYSEGLPVCLLVDR